MKLQDAKPGMNVRYIPTHAGKDITHPDCENGIVSSVNEFCVFVKYVNKYGNLGYTAQSTRPEDLVHFEFELYEEDKNGNEL